MKKFVIISGVALLIALGTVFLSSGQASQRNKDRNESGAGQWEYLVVSGGNLNLTSSGEGSLRKQPEGAFSREAFVLEKNMDKLGAKGWELVSVMGPPNDPILYFKRPKTTP